VATLLAAAPAVGVIAKGQDPGRAAVTCQQVDAAAASLRRAPFPDEAIGDRLSSAVDRYADAASLCTHGALAGRPSELTRAVEMLREAETDLRAGTAAWLAG
jgi:hypothetical protein